MPAGRLILIDGHGVMYRAFHAIPGLCTSGGQPTNAVFGMVRLLRQIRSRLRPTHWGVTFDGGMSERRRRLLESYKAQRPPMPDALRGQFAVVQEYLDLEGIAWIRQEGEEADDVMATLAAVASREGADVRLVTSDKDLCQLVDERIRVVPPGELDRELDAEAVREKMGVTPERVVEWLALTGDSVDNIEGVPGVGPKTATRLLDEYGGMGNLLDRLDSVEPARIRETIRTHRDRVRLNLELVALKRDLVLPVAWTSMTAGAGNPERVLPFLRRMEFGTLVQELEKEVAKSPPLGLDTGCGRP